jgi:hypothetical protein
MKEMVNFSAIHSYFESSDLPYFTFYPKSQKPIKAVIWHLPVSAPAEDISDGLVNLGFEVISVKQMSTTHRSPAGRMATVNIPLFLVNLPRMSKFHEIFKLMSPCHIAIRVEACKAQTGLMQSYDCQQFGHVWTNCKQPSQCIFIFTCSVKMNVRVAIQ